MTKSPLLAVLLVVSTVRGTNVVFHWPPSIRRTKHRSHVRYYSQSSHDVADNHDDDDVDMYSCDSSEESSSVSSEDSFNEDAARIGNDGDERASRSRASANRMMYDSSPSHDGLMRLRHGSSRMRSQTRTQSSASPDVRTHDGRSRSVSRVTLPRGSSVDRSGRPDAQNKHEQPFTSFLGFDLNILASILMPRNEQCHHRFELTIDDLTFMGHPVAEEHKSETSKHTETTKFNVVFVLDRSNMYLKVRCIEPQHWLNMFYAILFKLTAVLAAEEARAKYVTQQAYTLGQIREEALQEHSTIRECSRACLEECSIAEILRDVQRNVSRGKDVEVSINDRFNLLLRVPFLLQQPDKAEKAFELQSVYDMQDSLVQRGDNSEPSDLFNAYGRLFAPSHALSPVLQEWSYSTGPFLFPWKTLLLSDDAFSGENKNTIFSHTQSLVRLFQPTPTGFKTFAQAAEILQWDMYKHVYPLVRHMIYYQNALVIDVPRVQNLYAINPLFNSEDLPGLSERWQSQFPHTVSLVQFLEVLSTGLRPFVTHCVAVNEKHTAFNILLWLLREKVIVQIHIYLRFIITERDQIRAVELRRLRRETHANLNTRLDVREEIDSSDQDMVRGVSTPDYSVHDWPPRSVPSRENSHEIPRGEAPSSSKPARNVLERDVEEEGVEDLLPHGKPYPVMISEPARASRIESEWISAVFHGRNPWFTRWLIRLFPYLNGMHSVDEILAREKLRRRDLKSIMTEFQTNILHFYHP